MDTPAAKAADAAVNSHDVLQSHPSGWLCIEVAAEKLQHNLALFRERVRAPAKLMAVVKADGYGHGLCVAARAFLAGGADMLGVHSVAEALALRNEGLDAPVLVLGPATSREAAEASRRQVDLTVASPAAAEAVAATASQSAPCRVHLKVETGVYRQGICEEELDTVLSILTGADCVRLVGLSSHYADIEDTTDHSFARQQMERFTAFVAALAARGHDDLCRHMSCSAAAILWQNSHFDMVRVGISAYGIWPSRETFISARDAGHGDLPLRPALTWKCRVAQIKEVPAGCTVGYGRTWKAPTDSRIAVLPVGYSDGYPRALSGRAHVLIRGHRAMVTGRICMNLTLVDVTHITGVTAGDEAVLLGRQGEEEISADQLATYLNTIPYEIVTLPGPTWDRVTV